MKNPMLFALAILLVQCAGSDQPGPDEYIYWVNSLKVPCSGAGPAHCLQVQKAETPDPTRWESFYAPISGFEFEAGYICKLIVKETELDPSELPADASSVAYTLVKTLEKVQDKRVVLNDIWVLESLNGKLLDPVQLNDPSGLPQLEIHVGEMKYNGNDGCNNYFGGLIELDENTLRFGIGAGTRMMCQRMEIPDEFNRTLPEVNGYKVSGMTLQLFDLEGRELMQLKKVD